jgi:hypothetical protein
MKGVIGNRTLDLNEQEFLQTISVVSCPHWRVRMTVLRSSLFSPSYCTTQLLRKLAFFTISAELSILLIRYQKTFSRLLLGTSHSFVAPTQECYLGTNTVYPTRIILTTAPPSHYSCCPHSATPHHAALESPSFSPCPVPTLQRDPATGLLAESPPPVWRRWRLP